MTTGTRTKESDGPQGRPTREGRAAKGGRRAKRSGVEPGDQADQPECSSRGKRTDRRELDRYANSRSHSDNQFRTIDQFERLQENRRIKAEYRSILRDVSLIDRVCKCGITPRRSSGVGITVDMNRKPNQRLSGFRGLYSCGSVWACPRCAAIIGTRRADEVSEVLQNHSEAGGHGVMLTLTLAHSIHHDLNDIWDTVSDAWKNFTNNRKWVTMRKGGGLSGYIRGTEATVSTKTGWHVHLHILLLFDSANSAFDCLVQSGTIFQAWSAAVHNLGRGFWAGKYGQDVTPFFYDEDSAAIGEYLFKSSQVWSVADEITRWSIKKGKGEVSRTPFQLLASIANPEDWEVDHNPDLDLWHEWELASQGRRQLTWSRGLKKKFGPATPEMSNEEIASSVDHGAEESCSTDDKHLVDSIDQGTDEVAGITADEWIQTRAAERQNFLEAIRRIAESAQNEDDLKASLKNLGGVSGVEILVGHQWKEHVEGTLPLLSRRQRNRRGYWTKRWRRRTPEYCREIIDKIEKWNIRTVHFD